VRSKKAKVKGAIATTSSFFIPTSHFQTGEPPIILCAHRRLCEYSQSASYFCLLTFRCLCGETSSPLRPLNLPLVDHALPLLRERVQLLGNRSQFAADLSRGEPYRRI